MADDFHSSSSWWDTSSRALSSTTLTNMGSFDSSSGGGGGGGGGGGDDCGVILADPNLHMMGLGLSSQNIYWNNQALFRGEKASNGSFQMDSSVYGSPSSSSIIQGLLESDDHQQQQQYNYENRSMNYSSYPVNYGLNTNELVPSSWSKVPQFLRNSPPKQPPHSHLHFSNNAPFWNASATATNNVRSSFLPSLQTQFPTPTFDDKPKKTKQEVRDTGSLAKKSGSEAASKRARNESPSPLPPFKVRKEKMGDRVTALQQLVSPFGKTDTASVLSEAIEYIKFLHEQVHVLSTPYIKSGAPIQHQQITDKCNKDHEGLKQDLRSRGLCLVPVSSTFPVTHETTVDFWTPTFGGTFR